MSKPRPTEIQLHQKTRILEITFDDGAHFNLPCEYLRVHSPSAEVQGHGIGQEVLQVGKEDVTVTEIEPTGHYAIRLLFDDGHGTGIFTWSYLYELGMHQEEKWKRYLERLAAAGHERKTH